MRRQVIFGWLNWVAAVVALCACAATFAFGGMAIYRLPVATDSVYRLRAERYAPCSACGQQCGPEVMSGAGWSLCPVCVLAATDEGVPDGGIRRWAHGRLSKVPYPVALPPFREEADPPVASPETGEGPVIWMGVPGEDTDE